MRSPIPPLLALLATAPLLTPAMAGAQTTTRMRVVQEQPAAQTLEALPLTPPPAGPPPQGIRFEPSGTWGIFAKLAWNPAPNAIGYVVTRAKRDDATCCNATSGSLPATTTSWADAGLFRAGYYRYTLTVNYADGSVGNGAVDMGLLQGASPTGIKVDDVGPGRVRISWDPSSVPGTCCVKIVGPGLGAGVTEKIVLGGGPLNLTILPAGNYTWKLTGGYDMKNLPVQPATNYGAMTQYGTTYVVLAPPSEWAEVSHTVNYDHGRYRISLEGFKAINVTAEDPFRNDGRGDEVFITTQVSEYGRNGGLVSTRMLRTPTFGDVQNFPGRVQAGSAGNTGGIMPGDRYPAEATLISQLQPATTNNLPFLLWEGELSEIDNAVILSPAIWESDGGDQLWPSFANFHGLAAPGVSYRNQFNRYVPNSYGNGQDLLDSWNPLRSCPSPLSAQSPPTIFVPQIGNWLDEPIDMNQDHSYCPMYVAINAKMAREMTSVNSAMVVEIPFKNRNTGWEYTLYVRVEKVAPALQAVPASLRRRGQ
jgi:hypothetical protein